VSPATAREREETTIEKSWGISKNNFKTRWKGRLNGREGENSKVEGVYVRKKPW